jgi:prevent-host-death family protein
MENISFYKAKTHFLLLLDRIAKGEEFTITKHGKPVARLMPISSTKFQPDVRTAVAAMKAFRKGRSLTGLPIRDMIDEGRRA